VRAVTRRGPIRGDRRRIAERVVGGLPDLLESETVAYVSHAALNLLLPTRRDEDPWASYIEAWLTSADETLIDGLIERAQSGLTKRQLVFWMAEHEPGNAADP
jgi:hypothetical protein